MPLKRLAPSSVLQITSFSDIDAFRPYELVEDARSIALDPAHFSTARAVIRLPSCRVVVHRSFARILDATYFAPGGLLIMPLEETLQATANGMPLDAHCLIAVRGTDDCRFIEPRANLHAMIIFHPGLADRGWFDVEDRLQALPCDRNALIKARDAVFAILQAASSEPHVFDVAGVAEGLQELLLSAIDDLFSLGGGREGRTEISGGRSAQLVRLVDDYIDAHPTLPIYTAQLATELSVSMRTLGNAITKVRGMSLHQYIRLKRLWATRAHLLKGGATTIAASARAHGFHHMGEFAALYRATFNETPSATRAYRRQPPKPHW
ncbi:MAG: AraC family transcriptional regulator [Bradyrhizobium sp.]|uniref:AraC family transcriptional regulator n=1 Tax=Bradyrhizobium sp. TaxID=376 RepID=UPI0025BBC877|nr:AraC family transcriptional regulator [Bradyrhizobium sp.]MBI5263007.1 AraC family transcriptional regulator [Bradyrhizobium sp.]